MPIEMGAVMPLMNASGREEYSVIYFTDAWTLLHTMLLEGPEDFFKGRTPTSSPAQWAVNYPLSVNMESGRSPLKFERTAAVASLLLGGVQPDVNEDNLSPRLLFMPAAAQAMIDLAFLDGGFIAEFAIDTRTVNVTYVTPANHTPQFPTARVEPYTLALAPNLVDPDGNVYGQLHFDIGNMNQDRAGFIVDFLFDPTAILTAMIGMANSVAVNLEFEDLQNPTGARPHTPITKPTVPPAAAPYPRLSVEFKNVSDTSPRCVDSGIRRKSDGTLQLTDAVVKDY